MRKILLGVLSSMVLATGSAMAADINDGVGHSFKPHGKMPAADAMQMYNTPAEPTAGGTVVDSISGSGYSYIQVEVDGKRWWIAGTQIEVKKGDKVKYDENVVMENFFSKSLNRTFDRIVFASSVQVVR